MRTTLLRRGVLVVATLAAAATLTVWELTPGGAAPIAPTAPTAQSLSTNAHPLMGAPLPTGQLRLVAGAPAHLPGGLTMTVFGPSVGVPAGSRARLGVNALVPVTFTIRMTAGGTPLRVNPADFVLHMYGMPVPVAGVGSTGVGALAPLTIQAGATVERVLSMRSKAYEGHLSYAPGGVTKVSWVFVVEDD